MNQIIAIQGERASFHDIATTQHYKRQMPILPCESFRGVFEALVDGRATAGVCAIENTLYGSISEVYDLLLKHDVRIIGEVYVRIEQCLIGRPDVILAQIRHVYSHPVALAQCDAYLNGSLPGATHIESHDTAASVKMIKEEGDNSKAAIGSKAAAQLYGMKVMAHSIETNAQNYTRFVVLQKTHMGVEAATKASLVITTSGQSGALHEVLGVFARRGMSLTKLHSRPLVGQAWRYVFYLDVEADMLGATLPDIVQELEACAVEVRVLGAYVGRLAVQEYSR